MAGKNSPKKSTGSSVRVAAFAALFLLGCTGAGKRAADPLAAALATADEAWESRAATGNVDVAERAYAALLATWSEEGRVLWRLSRVAWSRALLTPADASIWHEAGREYAMRCLVATPQFGELVYLIGDRVTDVALAEIPVEAGPCAVYAAAHTVALTRRRGPGAALDLADVDPLLSAAERIAPGTEAALAAWTDGNQAFLLGELVEARAALRTAAETAPGQHFYRLDALALFPDMVNLPEGDDPVWALENAVSRPAP